MEKKELQIIIGRNLQRCRSNAGLTQEQTAEQAGISTSFYANLERGNRSMSALVLWSLANALGVSANALLYEEDADTHSENIRTLLAKQPAWFAITAENSVRTLLDSLVSAKILERHDTSCPGGEADERIQPSNGTD